jgi:hypothetical protein
VQQNGNNLISCNHGFVASKCQQIKIWYFPFHSLNFYFRCNFERLEEDPTVHFARFKHFLVGLSMHFHRFVFLSLHSQQHRFMFLSRVLFRSVSFSLFSLWISSVYVDICSSFASQNIFKTSGEWEVSEKQTQSQITRWWVNTRLSEPAPSELRASKWTSISLRDILCA